MTKSYLEGSWWKAVGGGGKWDSYCGSLVKWFDKNQPQMGVSKGLQSCKVKFHGVSATQKLIYKQYFHISKTPIFRHEDTLCST